MDSDHSKLLKDTRSEKSDSMDKGRPGETIHRPAFGPPRSSQVPEDINFAASRPESYMVTASQLLGATASSGYSWRVRHLSPRERAYADF